ncbi:MULTISPECIES: hypothetical protein [Streptomyces]|uniref:DUF2092 domain-containing protein n=1 Tax=Streptomyces evansiae TaxID=3075535 RepID=A0ABU2R385_9ACTN|nr:MULTISPECIES: hypothetical protein [unclassified Streptomyces]MDT0409740.1 hypothetical protein [Streptomyces sp. DSM 41979]MYQ56412.1 hypothetical protein [Streptomyces sp. SID4926]
MSPLCVPRRQGKTINTARRTTLAVATSAALALTGIAACGTVENLSAAQKIQKAADKLGEQHSLTVEFGLDADPKVLRRASQSDDPEDALSPTAAKAVGKLRISFSVEASKPLAEARDKDIKSFAFSVGSGKGAELLDVRMVDKTLYLRADVDAFGKTFDTPMPGADELPPEMGPLKDLFAGKWVKTDTSALEELGAGADASGKKSGADKLDSKTQRKLKTDLKSILARRVTFTDKGEKDGTDHILAKAPARALLTDILGAVEDVSDKVPAWRMRGMPTEKDLKDVPNSKLGVDFALKDGTLSGVTFDAAQLAEPGDPVKKGDKFDVVLRFDEPGKITAPAGARELPQGKKGTIFGMDPGLLLGGGPADVDALSKADPGAESPLDEDGFANDPLFRKEFEKQLRKEMDKQFGADWENGPMGDEIEKQIQEQLKLQFGDKAAAKG